MMSTRVELAQAGRAPPVVAQPLAQTAPDVEVVAHLLAVDDASSSSDAALVPSQLTQQFLALRGRRLLLGAIALCAVVAFVYQFAGGHGAVVPKTASSRLENGVVQEYGTQAQYERAMAAENHALEVASDAADEGIKAQRAAHEANMRFAQVGKQQMKHPTNLNIARAATATAMTVQRADKVNAAATVQVLSTARAVTRANEKVVDSAPPGEDVSVNEDMTRQMRQDALPALRQKAAQAVREVVVDAKLVAKEKQILSQLEDRY